MKSLTTFLLLLFVLSSFCQPSSFSWFSNDSEECYNYISPAKDQGEQGPCGIFASVAAIEALSHIYYHKPFHYLNSGLNLSEAKLYSLCSGYGLDLGAANAENTLTCYS